jgi:hypothetical protein
MEGRVSLLSDHRGTTRLIYRTGLKNFSRGIDLSFTSAQCPVLPRLMPPLLERSKVMALSLRFEPAPNSIGSMRLQPIFELVTVA